MREMDASGRSHSTTYLESRRRILALFSSALVIFLATFLQRPSRRSTPMKSRTGWCFARSTRNVPSPHPRSISRGLSPWQISLCSRRRK